MTDQTDTSTSSAEQDGFRFTVLLGVVVFLCYFFTSYRIGENAQTAAVIALSSIIVGRRWWVVSPWPWVVVLGSLLVTIAQRPIDVPNHHYVMTYVAIVFILVSTARDSDRLALLQENARWMLIVLMAFATVQKALQPTFRDGSYLAYELARGGFAGPLVPLMGEPGKKMRANDKLINEFRDKDPREVESVQLQKPIENFRMLAYGFAILIIGIELWLAAGMWLAPHWLLTHLSLIAFIVTLAVLRQEFTFISVVSLMGVMATDVDRQKLRLTYAVLAVFTAAAILKTLNY